MKKIILLLILISCSAVAVTKESVKRFYYPLLIAPEQLQSFFVVKNKDSYQLGVEFPLVGKKGKVLKKYLGDLSEYNARFYAGAVVKNNSDKSAYMSAVLSLSYANLVQTGVKQNIFYDDSKENQVLEN